MKSIGPINNEGREGEIKNITRIDHSDCLKINKGRATAKRIIGHCKNNCWTSYYPDNIDKIIFTIKSCYVF
jgi:hypothetical protein